MDAKTYNIRVLALKRWNLPQTTPIYTPVKDSQYGEYISFQSHHFIDILPDESIEASSIPEAYSALQKLRLHQRQQDMRDVHTVQSMTLLGRDGKFWERKPDLLYITFLQLTNQAPRDLATMEQHIQSIMQLCSQKTGCNPQWTLYYALDFCDMVLMTKDIPLEVYHDVLWHLALIRTGKYKDIRDTFTMYGLRYGFLADAFRRFDKKQPLVWNNAMALSVNLSIQDIRKWHALERKLKAAKISYTSYRTAGRYDLTLITETLSGPKVLTLLRCIDQLCDKNKDTAFGGYEVLLMAPPWHNTPEKSFPTVQNRKFEDAAGALMDKLCGQYCSVFKGSAEYVQETRLSFEALLKNGFSEEFVLSVFQSFITFMRISLHSANLDSLEKMNQHYFTALNTLALCTMHNERQFIQAPAFNATYFDVPPKLLVYYSSIVNRIAQALCDKKEPMYHFIISPDYRKDIHVNTILDRPAKDAQEHLAVICLEEACFYDPSKAIALFCHECSHYLSDRARPLRTKSIFRAVGLSLLCNSPLQKIAIDRPAIAEGRSLLNKLAAALELVLEEKYDLWCDNNTDYPKHHLQSIYKFLSTFTYGTALFCEKADQQQIQQLWTDAILLADAEEETCRVEINKYLNSLKDVLQCSFHLQTDDDSRRGQLCQIIAARAYNQMLLYAPRAWELHVTLCKTIIDAYSESYADLRMAELMGDSLTSSQYERLLASISDSPGASCAVRHDAVLSALWPNEIQVSWCNAVPQDLVRAILKAASVQIRAYLEQCHQNPCRSPEIASAAHIFYGEDVLAQFEVIYREIADHRNKMLRFCRKSLRQLSAK